MKQPAGRADVAPATSPARDPEQTILDLMLAAQLYRGRKGTGKGNRRALKALALKVRRAN